MAQKSSNRFLRYGVIFEYLRYILIESIFLQLGILKEYTFTSIRYFEVIEEFDFKVSNENERTTVK